MINTLTQQPITDDEIQSIAKLANLQLSMEATIEQQEKELADLKQQHRNLSEELLPQAMLAVGMESFSLSDGTEVEIKKFYSAKIPEDKQPEAFAWLRRTNNDSIIKREIKCLFGKGEDQMAHHILEILNAAGAHPVDKASVHPQTLKAFVREQIESGVEFPLDVFGAYVGNRAKLTPPTK